jgi:hypothetical protein
MPLQDVVQPCFLSKPRLVGARAVLSCTGRKKNMTEKVDLSGVLAYKTNLDDMDFGCSNSVAALAVLIGSGACAVLAPAACAGDRIDFSAPAIPLGVPQPEVEVKEPTRMIGSGGVGGGFMGGAEMAAPSQYFIVKPKSREKDAWGLDPLLGDDPDQRHADDWFTSQPDPTRVTNSNRLNTKQGLNPKDSGNQIQQRYGSGTDGDQNDSMFGAQSGWDRDNPMFGAKNGMDRDNPRFGAKNGMDRDNPRFGAKNGMDRDYSKFGAQNGLDKDKARSSDGLGRGFAGADDVSLWTKAFNHDAPGTDRFSFMRSMPSVSDAKPFSGGVYEERMNNPWLGQDSAPPAAPPSYPGSTPLDDGQSRLTGEPAGGSPVSLRAWDSSASSVLPPRSFSKPEPLPRVVAPNRPVTLSIPQRPGDPH